MGDTRVDHDQRGGGWKRHAGIGERPRIEEERRRCVGEAARHLVHDAYWRAHKVRFDPSPPHCQCHIVDLQLKGVTERAAESDFERRAGGEPASKRDRRLDARIEPRAQPLGREHPRQPLHVIDPGAAAALVAKSILDWVDVGKLRAPHADETIIARREVDNGPPWDRCGQDEAAVVIGVLADQIHPSGRFTVRGWRAAIEF